MSFISWILVGALAGWIASKIMDVRGQGCFTNVGVGIVGGLLGGFLVRLVGGGSLRGFGLYSVLVATLGAVLFIWVVRKLRK